MIWVQSQSSCLHGAICPCPLTFEGVDQLGVHQFHRFGRDHLRISVVQVIHSCLKNFGKNTLQIPRGGGTSELTRWTASLDDARVVFGRLEEHDLISWSIMIGELGRRNRSGICEQVQRIAFYHGFLVSASS